MTLLYTDPLFLKHDTGRHPETADRLRAEPAQPTARRTQGAGSAPAERARERRTASRWEM